MPEYLHKLIQTHLAAKPELKEELSALWNAIGQRFQHYEREIRILEHSAEMVAEDYESAVQKLRKLNSRLGTAISETSDKNELLSLLPQENPSPVFCFSKSGDLIYMNPAAQQIKEITYNKKTKPALDFLAEIIPDLPDRGQFECNAGSLRYIFIYRKTEIGDRVNFYGTDITAQWELQQRSYDNFYRLNNFLESTEAVHYIVYKQQQEKNFFTSRWPLFFGFNPQKEQDPLNKKKICIPDSSIAAYEAGYRQLEQEGRAVIKYEAVNRITGNKMWLEEEIKRSYDHYLNDEVLTGKITDITGTEFYKEYILESENRFKNITAALPVMTWVSDSNNYVTYSNNKIHEFFGKGLEEFTGPGEFEKLIHPQDRKRVQQLWQAELKKKQKLEVQFRIKGPGGDYRHIQEIAIPRFIGGEEFIGYIGSFFDLTKEYEYFARVEADKKQFELISINSSDITVLTSWKGVISYISPSVKRVLGYTDDELTGKKITDLIRKENKKAAAVYFSYNEHTAPHAVQTACFGMQKKTGEPVWVETAISRIDAPGMKDQHLILHIRDITEQQNSIDALAASEEKFRSLFENMALGVMEVDIHEQILYCNRAMSAITGYSSDEMVGNMATDLLLNRKEMRSRMEDVRKLRSSGQDSSYEINIRKKNGEAALLVVSGAPLYNKNGTVRGSVGIHWDITEMRELERKLTEEKINKEKEIVEATLLAEEEQRAQIGRDLHDGVGQMLTYINLYLGIIRSRGSFTPADVNELEKTVKNTLEQVRTLSRTLAPPAIRDLGLREAVVELIESYGILDKPKFKLRIYNQKEDNNINLDKKIVFFRVLQELLNNTFKYADAGLISIQFYYLKDHLHMYYSDNGKGFDMKKIRKGVGLDSIRSRVSFYKGNVSIKAAPGKGMTVNIKIPV